MSDLADARARIRQLPVGPDTCTVLGCVRKAGSPLWTGLHFNGNEKLRTQSTMMLCVCGAAAPYDLHLSVPWEHPDDYQGGEPDCLYRVRPRMEVGKRWKGRLVEAVAIKRNDDFSPPWMIEVEFA